MTPQRAGAAIPGLDGSLEEELNLLAVIAEFKIRDGAEAIFEQALGAMQAHVETFDSYLGEEPCQSLADTKLLVTIFYWRDRRSMAAWRNDTEHRRIQELV